MAYSYVRYTGNGSTQNYTFSFPYINQDHIKVRVNGVITTAWSFLNSSTVQFTSAPANGAILEIRRETPKDSAIVNFTDGSVLLERDLDLLATYDLYLAQETKDGLDASITQDSLGVWDGQSKRITNVADPVSAQDVATKNWSETSGQSFVGASSASAASALSSATSATASATSATASAASAAASATSATASASNAAISEANSLLAVTYYGATAPSPILYKRWISSDDLREYIYLNDGDSSQWVEVAGPTTYAVQSAQSSDVSFLQSGTSAVERTAQDKMRETVSVKDFGAVGDGVTDDTAAIQAAVNACSAGSILNFPLGIYLISSTITIATPSVMLKGVSNPEYVTVPTVKMTTASGLMFNLTSAGTVFEGLKFLGNGGVYGAGATVNGVKCSANSGTDCDNQFNSCTFVYLNKCIEIKGKNVNTVNTLFSNSLYGIYLDRNAAVAADFRGLSVTGCRFHSLGGASTAAYGIYVVGYASEANFRELIFVGNYVDDSYAAIYGCINSATITGNMFTRMRGAGSTIELDLTNSTFTASLRNIVITGNSLFCNDTMNTSTGIKLTGTCTPVISSNEVNLYQYHGITLSGISGYLITNNTVSSCGAAAGNLYDGINISGTTVGSGVISANRISGAGTGRSGIYIQSTNNPGTNNRNLITSNYISSYSTPVLLSANNVAVSNTFGTCAVVDCLKNSALGATGSFTLTPSVDSPVQRHATTLTGNLTVTMATTNTYDGAYFKIIRAGGGAFTFTVDMGGGGTSALTQNQYLETMFSAQAGAWVPIAKGSIV